MRRREDDAKHKEIWQAIGKIEATIEDQENALATLEADVQLMKRKEKREE